MPNRERMLRNPICKEVEEILADELGKHEGLQKLNQLRREQQVLKNPKDTKFLEEVVSNLIKNNHSIVNYLGLGTGIKDVKKPGSTIIEKYEGKKFPTYLKILSYNIKDNLFRKQIPINSYARLYLETDATNDYFNRASETGELKITPDISSAFHLWNGIITIKLIPPNSVAAGDIDLVKIELTRPYDDLLVVEFEAEYSPPIQPQSNISKQKDVSKGISYKLPQAILVYKEKKEGNKSWQELDPIWTGEDIAKVAVSGGTNGNSNNLDIYINMEADILYNYSYRHNLSTKQKDFIEKTWQAAIFLYSLVLHNDLTKLEQEDLLPEVMKSISKMILDLTQNEALFKNIDE